MAMHTVMDSKWAEILEHTLGAKSEQPGYRNRYCVTIGSERHETLKAMEEAGFMKAFRITPDGKMQFYCATEIGAQRIGLTPKQIRRAFSN